MRRREEDKAYNAEYMRLYREVTRERSRELSRKWSQKHKAKKYELEALDPSLREQRLEAQRKRAAAKKRQHIVEMAGSENAVRCPRCLSYVSAANVVYYYADTAAKYELLCKPCVFELRNRENNNDA